MSLHVARSGVLELAGSAIAFVENCNFDESNSMHSAPVMGATFVGHQPGLNTYTGSFTLNAKPGEASHTAITAGAALALDFYPDGNASGKTKESYTEIILGSVGRAYEVDGVSKRNVSFSANSEPTYSVVV